MKGNLLGKVKWLLRNEIAIEYKTCLYSFCIIVFYCIYLLCVGVTQASILYLCEIFCTAYVTGYLQYYLLGNLDEAEQISAGRLLGMLGCSLLYTVISYFFQWFGRGVLVTVLFFIFMLSMYLCIFLINKIKRVIDTQQLNRLLKEFKKGEVHDQ